MDLVKKLLMVSRDTMTCPVCHYFLSRKKCSLRENKQIEKMQIEYLLLWCPNCKLYFATTSDVVNIGDSVPHSSACMKGKKIKRKTFIPYSCCELKQISGIEYNVNRERSYQYERCISKVERVLLDDEILNGYREKSNRCERCISEISRVGTVDSVSGENTIYRIVSDDIERNILDNIICLQDEIAQKILVAISSGSWKYYYQNKLYKLVYYHNTSKIRQAIEKYAKFSDPRNLVDVVIYRGKLACRTHPHATEAINALVWCTKSEEPVAISIYYCSVCNEYYINDQQYNRFAEKYGIPMILLCFDDRNWSNDAVFSTWKEKSKLFLYGYSVDKNSDLSEVARKNRLCDLIDTGIMKKTEITHWIEFLLRTRTSRLYADSRIKWESDLNYVNDYYVNQQRFIWANFLPYK